MKTFIAPLALNIFMLFKSVTTILRSDIISNPYNWKFISLLLSIIVFGIFLLLLVRQIIVNKREIL